MNSLVHLDCDTVMRLMVVALGLNHLNVDVTPVILFSSSFYLSEIILALEHLHIQGIIYR
jgi:hypothetical protein